MNAKKKPKLLLLTLVHPDFLPPVYASAQTLRDLDYDVHILTFDSLVPSDELNIGNHIEIETLGKHHNVSIYTRLALRAKFAKRAAELVRENPVAVIAYCPFSFLTAVKFKKKVPVIYFAMEVADFATHSISRSPLSHLNRLLALKAVKNAHLVATPSVQRSAWLAGRCHLNFMPHTIFNTAYISAKTEVKNSQEVFKKLVPQHFLDKKIVLYTGNVNERLCVFELVKAFELLNDENCALIVTGIKDNKYCSEIKDFVEHSKNKNNIKLYPYVTRSEMLALQEHAHIGACLTREYDDIIVSKMIAPNKVGEYLDKGLFIVGVKSEYMNLFEYNGVAALADSPSPNDITLTLRKALDVTNTIDYRNKITYFVQNYFCMQHQLKPIIRFLALKSK